MSKAESVADVSRKIGVSDVTFCRWRMLYSGMQILEAKRLMDIKEENTRLGKLSADLSLDNAILKEASNKNF